MCTVISTYTESLSHLLAQVFAHSNSTLCALRHSFGWWIFPACNTHTSSTTENFRYWCEQTKNFKKKIDSAGWPLILLRGPQKQPLVVLHLYCARW